MKLMHKKGKNIQTNVAFQVISFAVLLLFAGINNLGCARNVTQIVDYGEQMMVTVTLRGTVEVAANRYFLVLSGNSGLTVPHPPPDNPSRYEMIEPGTVPINGTLADYYTNYYSTWGGYVIADTGGYFTVMGAFIEGQAITRESLTNLGTPSTTLNFTVPLNKIFSSTPNTIYFDFITVDWPDGQPKIPSDRLTTTNAYISKLSGSIQSIDDTEDPGVDAALDILRCRIEMQ
jgi:hypothetical protein